MNLENVCNSLQDKNAIEVIKDYRRDAEHNERSQLPGIDMLRNWLRSLHMKVAGGWNQDTSQDEIAKILGEYPRNHPRQFKVRNKNDK